MTLLKRFLIALFSLTFLSGCSTNVMMDDPEYLMDVWESRFARGFVAVVIEKDIQSEWIDSFEDDEFHLLGMDGYTREQLKNDFDLVGLRVQNRITDDWSPGMIFARSELNLEFHDVVDFYTGMSDKEDMKAGIIGYSEPRILKLGTSPSADVQFIVGEIRIVKRVKPAIVLGVVCRDCFSETYFGSKREYTIGIGRRMSGPEDYRGVEAESQQEVGVIRFHASKLFRW